MYRLLLFLRGERRVLGPQRVLGPRHHRLVAFVAAQVASAAISPAAARRRPRRSRAPMPLASGPSLVYALECLPRASCVQGRLSGPLAIGCAE